MKFQVIFFLLMVVSVTFIGALNIQNLVRDRRYVEEQKKLNALLPEALHNNCRRCTSQQLEHARTVIEFMQQNYPYEWQQIVQHYAAN